MQNLPLFPILCECLSVAPPRPVLCGTAEPALAYAVFCTSKAYRPPFRPSGRANPGARA